MAVRGHFRSGPRQPTPRPRQQPRPTNACQRDPNAIRTRSECDPSAREPRTNLAAYATPSSKPSCSERTASSAYFASMTHEILISDVEIK